MTQPIATASHTPVQFEVAAPTETALVQSVLERVLALAGDGQREDHDGASVIGFRGVAPDLAALLGVAVGAAFGAADDQGMRVLAAEVAGVMATDEGIRCWGTASVEPATGPVRLPVVVGLPIVWREAGSIRAVLIVGYEGVGDA